MRKDVPALAALATSLLMVSCTAGPSGAKEQTRMSAALKEDRIPFKDPAVLPMARAIAAGDAARIRALAPTTDLSARGEDDVTLLAWAIWTQQPASLAALLEAGADPAQLGTDQETVAHLAAMVEPPGYLRILIEHGAPTDIVSPRGGWTPIFRAVESRRDAQIEMLIDAGASVTRKDAMGNTLLHQAAKVNSGDLVVRLLELGLDPETRNAQDSTFQPYYFMTPERLLNDRSKQQRRAVEDWLTQHGITRE